MVVLEKTRESLGLQGDQVKSISKEMNPGYSLKGLILRLQYFGHLMRRADSLENTLMLGKIEAGEKGKTEDKMVGWYHQLNGYESE